MISPFARTILGAVSNARLSAYRSEIFAGRSKRALIAKVAMNGHGLFLWTQPLRLLAGHLTLPILPPHNAERPPYFHSPQVAHSAMMTAVALYDRRMRIPLYRQTCEEEQWRCVRRLNYDAAIRIKQ